MKITVIVKIKSKVETVEKASDNSYTVRVNAQPVKGEANLRIIELLSEYFKVPKTAISIVKGHLGKRKIIEICL